MGSFRRGIRNFRSQDIKIECRPIFRKNVPQKKIEKINNFLINPFLGSISFFLPSTIAKEAADHPVRLLLHGLHALQELPKPSRTLEKNAKPQFLIPKF